MRLLLVVASVLAGCGGAAVDPGPDRGAMLPEPGEDGGLLPEPPETDSDAGLVTDGGAGDAGAPPLPRFETVFSQRPATNGADTSVEDKLVSLIDHAVPGSRVRVSQYARRLRATIEQAPVVWPPRRRTLPYDFRYGRPALADFPHDTWCRILGRRARRLRSLLRTAPLPGHASHRARARSRGRRFIHPGRRLRNRSRRRRTRDGVRGGCSRRHRHRSTPVGGRGGAVDLSAFRIEGTNAAWRSDAAAGCRRLVHRPGRLRVERASRSPASVC